MTSSAPMTVLENVLTWLVHAGWQAAVLGLLVYFASRALQGRLEARWHYCLWLVVLARLALPVVPAAPWSLFGLMPAAIGGRATEDKAIARPIAKSYNPVARERAGAVGEAPEVPSQSIMTGEPNLHAPVATFWTWLAVAWLCGVLVLLARQSWRFLQLYHQQRAWSEVTDPTVRDMFRDCRKELGIVRPARLLIAAGEFGPATCGVFRAWIVMPKRLVALLSPDELRLVLLHELTHVRRWDVLLDRVAALLVAVHWFNPVAWLALGCLRRERELACDAAVLQHLGDTESGRYGYALLKVAQHLLVPARLPGAVGVIGKGHSLVGRIHMIAKYSKPTVAGKMLGGMLLFALAAFGLTDVVAEPAFQSNTGQPAAGQATEAPNAKKQEQPAEGTFEALYALHEGEILKRIAPPFPPGRLEYYRTKLADQAEAIPHGPTVWTFRWKDGKLSRGGMNIGPDPRLDAGTSLPTLLQFLTDIYPQDIEGDEALINDGNLIKGDFIVRVGAPPEKVVSRLEEILRKECGVPIKLVLQKVERPVFVARGKFELKPIKGYDKNSIQLYGKQLVPDSGAGGGTGTFGEFLQHAGAWVGRRVTSDAEGLPKKIGWGNHMVSPYTEQQKKEDHDPEQVLQHVSEQTGLTFKEENRKVRMLFVERTLEQPK